MNRYVKASLMSHCIVAGVFFTVPIMLLASTQRAENAAKILAWLVSPSLGIVFAAIGVGGFNNAIGRLAWGMAVGEAVVVLLGGAIGAALPGMFWESHRDALAVAVQMGLFGLPAALLAAIFHYGSVERITATPSNDD